jgi:hypothetical protein
MLQRIIVCAAIVAGYAGIAQATPQDDITAALQKLADSPNYSWKTSVDGGFGAGATEGKTQKDGLTTLSITRQDNTYDAVIQGDKAAVKIADAWKSAADLAAAAGGAGGGGNGGGQTPERFLARMIQTFKTPVDLALPTVSTLQNVQKTDDAYTADLTEDAAKQLLARPRRANAGGNAPPAPDISNAKATVKVWIADGAVTKMESHVTGTVSFNGNDRDIDRTTTTEFKDVGTTTITVPDEAKAILAAPPATQP